MNKDKFISHEGEMHEITNEDMVCKDCIKRFSFAARCGEYLERSKPLKVINGGECEYKIKE